eukprot:CAMPEP_0184867770 /NCGR_PEP_ID=MMETSP0580-20130426/27648_1 /TAXON_ID=1118495 /ORGANISM="Dactyliosolen fragilissimus" /LENGTH=322 /DNA_ID=CAMNT_0027368221 /DNA_START=25 /DNA_END=993 /DNA_ORIENTATION=-
MSSSLLCLLVSSIITCVANGINLDIHLPLTPDSCPFSLALESNLLLQEHSIAVNASNSLSVTYDEKAVTQTVMRKLHGNRLSEEINFFDVHRPHLTLYLADFDLEDRDEDGMSIPNTLNETRVELFQSKIREAISKDDNFDGDGCAVNMDVPLVNGAYAMWNVLLSSDHSSSKIQSLQNIINATSCLQRLSDSIVNNTYTFYSKNDTLPDWVHNLPEPERSRKIRLFELYGSPNVFDEFVPHVTVGYDEIVSVESRRATLYELVDFDTYGHVISKDKSCHGAISNISVGRLGNVGGTVLINGTVFTIGFNEKQGESSFKTIY